MAITDPIAPLPGSDGKVLARFLARLDRTSQCWIWTGARVSGRSVRDSYGVVQVDGHREKAHRVSWQLFVGPIPGDLCVLHDCPGGDNKLCVNPGHLWLGTRADNNADMRAKGRQAAGDGHGSRLHPGSSRRGSAHWNARVTEEIVRAIRMDTGTSAEIARARGLGRKTVLDIRRRVTWKHVA